MTNTHNLLMSGLKQVSGDTKNLGGYYSGRYLQLNYNKSTGEVFTNFHYSLGQNSWSEYNDPNILVICNLSSPTTMQEIADLIYDKLEYLKMC